MSFVGSEALNQALGSDAEGVIVTQVVPLPEGDSAGAREFQSIMPAHQRTFVSFEGFVVAQAFVKTLQACPAMLIPRRLSNFWNQAKSLILGWVPSTDYRIPNISSATRSGQPSYATESLKLCAGRIWQRKGGAMNLNNNNSIEKNIKRIGVVGAVLLLAFATTLFVVQHRLIDSQDRLTDTILPIKRKLGELTANVGALFLRQNEIISTDSTRIKQFSNREREEAKIRENHVALTILLSKPSVARHPKFPVETVEEIQRDVDDFLRADTQLCLVAARQCEVRNQFENAIQSLESDLQNLMIDSAGAAGVLRLNTWLRCATFIVI